MSIFSNLSLEQLGFHWADADVGGAKSVVWYEQWLEQGDEAAPGKIIEYNQNDVEATRLIKDWLAGLKKTKPDTP